jgi:hypothetical protein
VTEADWLACTDPLLMLDELGRQVSRRKARLILCAWAGQSWRLMDERSRAAVDVAERFADGLADTSELIDAQNGAQEVWRGIEVVRRKSSRGEWGAMKAAAVARDAASPSLDLRALKGWARGGNGAAKVYRSDRLRCLFANPFRSVRLDPAWLAWNESTVRQLAEAVYAERAFDRLPVLADALEDAGCSDAELLGHLRSGGEHVRGCWSVDLILGKG